MTGQDSEQATGAASARSTCARDVPQNRVDWPLLIVLGIAWSGEADVLLGLHLRESGSFGLSVCIGVRAGGARGAAAPPNFG